MFSNVSVCEEHCNRRKQFLLFIRLHLYAKAFLFSIEPFQQMKPQRLMNKLHAQCSYVCICIREYTYLHIYMHILDKYLYQYICVQYKISASDSLYSPSEDLFIKKKNTFILKQRLLTIELIGQDNLTWNYEMIDNALVLFWRI